MKKLVFTTLLLLMVVLSACNSVQDYLPGCRSDSCNDTASENETSYVVIDNPFEFTGNEGDTLAQDVEVVNLNEDFIINETPDKNVSVIDESLDVLTTIDVVEGDKVSLLDLIAQDPDGDTIEYSYSLPLSSDGEWQTVDGDEGTYVVSVTASDGLLSTSENIKIVVAPSNKGPIIDCPNSLSFKEGEAIEVPCTIYDEEGDEVTFNVSGYADELSFQSGYDDAGTKKITVVASDGNKETSKTISLKIANVNRIPLVKPFEDIVALEGGDVELSLVASDADGDVLEITYPLLFDETGVWSTKKGDAGRYELEVVVSDGSADVVVPINILIEKVNMAPKLSLKEHIVVDEGDIVDLNIKTSDEDGDDVSLVIKGFMTTQTYQTTYTDAGVYNVTVSASDGKKDISKTVTITINDVNRAPVFILK